jgi:hypothetical protein
MGKGGESLLISPVHARNQAEIEWICGGHTGESEVLQDKDSPGR